MARFPFLVPIGKGSKEMDYFTSSDDPTFLDETKFQTLFDDYPDAVIVVDTRGKVLYFNPAVESIFGYKERVLIRDYERHMKKEHKGMRKQYYDLAMSGQAQRFQAVDLNSDGDLQNIDINYIPIMGNDLQVKGIYAIAKNITKYIELESESNKVKNSLELAQQIGEIGSWDYDFVNDKVFLSKQALEFVGENDDSAAAFDLNKLLQNVHPDDRGIYIKTFKEAVETRQGYTIEYRLLRKDGSCIYVSDKVETFFDQKGNPIRLIGVTKNITNRILTEKNFRESEEMFEHIYDNLSLGIRSFDLNKGKFILVSAGMKGLTGYPLDHFFKHDSWDRLIHPADYPDYVTQYAELSKGKNLNLQYRIFHKNGEIVWVHDKTLPVFDEEGRFIRTDGIVTNISAQKEYEKSIEYLAYYCSLTDLPNRALFKQKIESLIERFAGTQQKFSVLHMDLDRFRNINDTLGHSIGDRLLQQVGPRIQELLNPSSFLAKIGEDEFGVILWDYSRVDALEILAENILNRLREPFMIDDFELYLTVSVGIASYPSSGTTLDELIKSSDIALYRAEANGKNSYQVYSSTLNITTYKQFDLERDLRKSIENEQLLVYFQPRVDAFSGKIVSAEALVRWEHPVWGIVSPGEFIPLAEETGFINDIGDWVLKQVCQYIAGWKERNLPVVPISINITAQRFLKNNWKNAFADALQENHIDPALIEVEITETTLLQNDKAVEAAFQFLRAKGIKIALDDFGTGFSSLSHIKDFSIDTIKIDQSFVSQITKQVDVEMIIKSLIFMAKGLDMNIVAEGVETVEQLTFLKQQECSEIQGYIFSKPVPEGDFQLLLKKAILKPIYSTAKLKVDNRRRYYRIDLPHPLSSKMTITSIRGKEVSLGKTEVLVGNIGPGGMRFLSTMHLPIRPDIVFQFETTIMEHSFRLEGNIVWKNEVKEAFKYGIKFVISEEKRAKLIKALHLLSLKLG